MYYNSVWPGAYSFQGEIKSIISWFREQLDIILKEIEEKEKFLNEH